MLGIRYRGHAFGAMFHFHKCQGVLPGTDIQSNYSGFIVDGTGNPTCILDGGPCK